MVIIVTVEFFRVARCGISFTGLRLRVYNRILGNRLQSVLCGWGRAQVGGEATAGQPQSPTPDLLMGISVNE